MRDVKTGILMELQKQGVLIRDPMNNCRSMERVKAVFDGRVS